MTIDWLSSISTLTSYHQGHRSFFSNLYSTRTSQVYWKHSSVSHSQFCQLKHAVTVCCLVCCFEFIFSATHKCNTLCHEAITVQVTIFWVYSTFFGFQLEFHDVNLVKLWTGKSMKIYRSFVTTIWNQVMSLMSVKLSGTHLVSCTVIATWHRVLH